MKANDVKNRLTRDDIALILSGYGFEISLKDFKFCLREERTPSAFINQDCSIHDYGTDFHGDILDVLQEYKNLSFTEALEVVKAYIGIDSSVIVPPRPTIEPKKEYVSSLTDARHKQIVKTIEWYDSQSPLQTFTNPDYASEALSICPLWVFQQATREALNKFKQLTTYDFKNKTLVIKIHDYKGKLISYKRRRFNKGKWVAAKDTHPNYQCLVSIKDDGNSICIVEGHHDFLTAVLLGLNVIAVPTVAYKSFTEDELSLLKNKDVILIADYDVNNAQGVECMKRLALQADEVATATKVFSLPKFLENENISFNGTKLDLSEVVELWSHGLEAFTNVLAYRADENIFNEGELF